MYGRHWNSGGIQDIKSNSIPHLMTPNLFPRAGIQLISSLVVESTRQRVEHLRIVPHYQIPPILWNRRWKFLQTWKYILWMTWSNEINLIRGRYLMSHKAVKCKRMAEFVDNIWFKIPEQIKHADTIYTKSAGFFYRGWLTGWTDDSASSSPASTTSPQCSHPEAHLAPQECCLGSPENLKLGKIEINLHVASL